MERKTNPLKDWCSENGHSGKSLAKELGVSFTSVYRAQAYLQPYKGYPRHPMPKNAAVRLEALSEGRWVVEIWGYDGPLERAHLPIDDIDGRTRHAQRAYKRRKLAQLQSELEADGEAA